MRLETKNQRIPGKRRLLRPKYANKPKCLWRAKKFLNKLSSRVLTHVVMWDNLSILIFYNEFISPWRGCCCCFWYPRICNNIQLKAIRCSRDVSKDWFIGIEYICSFCKYLQLYNLRFKKFILSGGTTIKKYIMIDWWPHQSAGAASFLESRTKKYSYLKFYTFISRIFKFHM